jgi:hypothetical protein
MKKLYSFLMSFAILAMSFGQTVYLAEHFDYKAGDKLQDNNWYAHSAGTTNPILVTDGGLSWSKTAYLGSGVGNAAAVSNTGSDENRPFSTWASSGNVYTSFLLKVDTVSPGFFFHLGFYSNTSSPVYTSLSTSFRARTFIDNGSTAAHFKLGLDFNSSTATNFTGDLKIGETYLVVVKYAFIDGTGNDEVSLYVFADGDDISSEPTTPAIGPLTGTVADADILQAVCLRQYNAAQDIIIDGVIAQDAWNLLKEEKKTRTVKFAVDMKNQTVSADGVHVAGNFQGWDPAKTKLTQEGSTSIYATEAEVDFNTVIEYKFINGNGWGSAESVPAISQKGHSNNNESNDNRWAWSGSDAENTLMLPAVLFGSSASEGHHAVRLAVDLQKENSVSDDGVHVAGSLQGWNPSTTRLTNLFNTNKVYEIILDLENGDYEYKFVNGNSWGSDESVPSSCATNNNRGVTVKDADVEAKKVCFGSCDACPEREIPKYNATFQIDMRKECNFEKVDIAGGRINGWNGGDFLTDDDKDGVYTITVKLDSGVEVAHKVRKIDANGNVNWEGGSDRKYTIHGDTTFAVRCFGLDEPCSGSVIAPSDIVFRVDMSKEIPQDTVWLMGSFTSPAWQGGAIAMTANADNADIYEVTVEKLCSEYFEYKFVNEVMSSSSNGETFPDSTDRACVKNNGVGGFNRHYTRTGTETVTLGFVYNSCAAIQSNATENLRNVVRIAPNPASGSFMVTLNANQGTSTINVMSLDGRVMRKQQTQTTQTTVDVSGLTGIYFVQVIDASGTASVHKIVLQ